MRTIFKAAGAQILEIEPRPEMPDLVFTADPSLSLSALPNGTGGAFTALTLLSRFSNEERQEEVGVSHDFFQKNIPGRKIVNSTHRIEGSGDNIYDPFRDVYWSGYNPRNASREMASFGRSDIQAHGILQALTGVEVNSLAVKKPFYHVDLSVGPLNRGHILHYEGGLLPDGNRRLMSEAFDRFGLSRDEYLIPVSREDAERAACNIRCIGNLVVMPSCSDELQERIRSKGYEVAPTPMYAFFSAGGAVHCTTNEIDQPRIPGGYARRLGFERTACANH